MGILVKLDISFTQKLEKENFEIKDKVKSILVTLKDFESHQNLIEESSSKEKDIYSFSVNDFNIFFSVIENKNESFILLLDYNRSVYKKAISTKKITCFTCGGSGRIFSGKSSRKNPELLGEKSLVCPFCGGYGFIDQSKISSKRSRGNSGCMVSLITLILSIALLLALF